MERQIASRFVTQTFDAELYKPLLKLSRVTLADSRPKSKTAAKNIDFIIDGLSMLYNIGFYVLCNLFFGKRLRRKRAAFAAVHAIMYVVLLRIMMCFYPSGSISIIALYKV